MHPAPPKSGGAAGAPRIVNNAAEYVGFYGENTPLKYGGRAAIIFTQREEGVYLVSEIMLKKNCPIRTMKLQRHNRIATGHIQTVRYIVTVTA